MYTFNAIILEKNIIREKHIRIIVLSKEYGKITLWYYKQLTGVDIGDIARFVVKRDKSINIIKNIDTKKHLLGNKWNYETLIHFLELLKILKVCTMEDSNIPHIYNDYENIFKTGLSELSVDSILLMQMRIFKHLGSLNPQFFETDRILNYMYDKICLTPLEKIIKSQKLKDDHRVIIQKSNLFSFSTFL